MFTINLWLWGSSVLVDKGSKEWLKRLKRHVGHDISVIWYEYGVKSRSCGNTYTDDV